MKQKVKYLLIAIVIAGYFSCQSDSNCGTNAANFVRFSMVDFNEEGEEVDSSSAYNYFYATQEQTLTDTLLIFPIERLAFDLSPAYDMLQYVFVGLDADSMVNRVDTLEIAYRKINRVDSPDCPIDFSFTDLEVVYQTFDSAVIVNRNLTFQNNAPNIKLYTN